MAPNDGHNQKIDQVAKSASGRDEAAANGRSSPQLLAFPSAGAKPHELDRWLRSVDAFLVNTDLLDVAKERFPAGQFTLR